MTEPTEFLLEDFTTVLDDDMENCVLTLTGEDGEKVIITIDREMAEEMSNELAQILALEPPEEDD